MPFNEERAVSIKDSLLDMLQAVHLSSSIQRSRNWIGGRIQVLASHSSGDPHYALTPSGSLP
jgi:hypothetical protein